MSPVLGSGTNAPFMSGSLYILLGFFDFTYLHLSAIAMATAIAMSMTTTPATTAPAIMVMGADFLAVLPEAGTKEVGTGEEVGREEEMGIGEEVRSEEEAGAILME